MKKQRRELFGQAKRARTDIAHESAVLAAINHMKAGITNPVDLTELSHLASFSKFHFIRVFEEVTGTTPHSFLSSIRIAEAKKRLKNSQDRVTDICLDVGFTSLGSFSSAFAERVGMTPTEYRRKSKAFDLRELQAKIAAFIKRQQYSGGHLRGLVRASGPSTGIIFVGAFDDGVPRGKPLAGTVLTAPGEYRVASPDAPSFHLLAVTLLFTPDDIPLVESVAGVKVSDAQFISGVLPTLHMRTPGPTDPPILLEPLAVF